MGWFRRNWRGSFFLAGLLLVWIAVAELRLVDPIILPSPISVVQAMPGMLRERLLVDVALTLARVLGALLLACAFGIPFGLLLGYRKGMYRVIEGPLHALRSIPASALFPLFLIIIGVGERSIVALAAYPSLLVILVNTVSGATLANKRRLYQARLFGLSTWDTISDVLFYEALPNIFDGIRTAVSYALVLVVAVEMFIGLGDRGLGRGIYEYQSTYRIPETYGAIIIAGVIGILLNGVVSRLEGRMLRWLPHAHEEN
ncbi:MAG TPA: ABC transporter permease subunit [Terriglobales bacterium]|jgi:ABC-type nitrate/sulfonate/bicarbonate transport system permease component|nr:ABC transporter permease subunit [Terriglobales bacterium]